MNDLNWVNQIEIELHNKCNLLCPLCVRQNPTFNHFFIKPKEIPLDDLINTLDRFPNLTKVHLVGNSSEPTLYSNFIELIKYLNTKNISIMISSNMSTKNEFFWNEVSKLLKEKDEIRFAIDGSTQEDYEQYRVNGKLSKALNNIKIMESTNALKVLQIIKFKGNENNYEDQIKDLLKIIKIDYVYRLNTNSESLTNKYLTFPKKEKIKQSVYNGIYKDISKLKPEERLEQIFCYSKNGFIYINHRGEFITCCDRYEEFLNTDNLKIKDFKIDKFNGYYRNIFNSIQDNSSCIKNCNKKLLRIEHDRDHLVKDTK